VFDKDEQFNVDYQLYLDSKARVAEVQEQEKLLQSGEADAVQINQPFYSPLVKISVWPSFRRYTPGNGKKGGERAGFRVYEIFKSGVVYYWAPANRKDRDDKGIGAYLRKGKVEGGEGIGQWLKSKLFFGYLG